MSTNRRVRFLNSIQVSLALAIGLIVMVILSSMGLLLYNATDKIVVENSNETTRKMIQQVNYDIDYYLNTVETTIESIRYSDAIADYFEAPTDRNRMRVAVFMDSLLISREDIINIALIHPDGTLVTNDPEGVVKTDVDFTLEPYYVEAIKGEGMQVSSSHVQNILLGQYQWVVSCSSGYNLERDGANDGVILVDLNFNLIEDMVSRIAIGDKGYIFIIDDNGEMVYHPKRELIYSGIRTEKIEEILASESGELRVEVDGYLTDYIITDAPFSSWKIIGKVFVEDINSYRESLQSYFFSLIAISLIIAVLLSFILASSILSPVNRLLEGIDTFQTGQLDVDVHVEVENELGLLTTSFNNMTKRIKALVEENKRSERNKRKSELEALQAQINPHFLYNTLDSIVWMGEANRTDEVVKMTSSLAKLFRISINKGQEYISLKQEIEHVESYLTIQKMRYGDKLNYEIDVDPQLLNERIIKILLQPIVENAIYHGIKQLPGEGLVQIRVYKEMNEDGSKAYMHIEIEDNGLGMDKATIGKLLRGEISSDTKGSGVGVYNVDQRIKLYYGDDYGMDIKSELFEGTIITLVLPYGERGPDEEI